MVRSRDLTIEGRTFDVRSEQLRLSLAEVEIEKVPNRGGLGFMRHSISNSAEYGDLTCGARVISPAVREEMRKLLADIRNGVFAKEWIAECRAGAPRFAELRRAAQNHQIEQVGARLRAMMPWTEEGKRAKPKGPAPKQADREPARA